MHLNKLVGIYIRALFSSLIVNFYTEFSGEAFQTSGLYNPAVWMLPVLLFIYLFILLLGIKWFFIFQKIFLFSL